jgi:hypothetical protein
MPLTSATRAREIRIKGGDENGSLKQDRDARDGGLGEFATSGKNASGAAIGDAGYWTATYVRDGGAWKVRMLTGFPKAPPPE